MKSIKGYAEVLGVKTLPVFTKYFITVEDKDHNDVYNTSDATFSISGSQPVDPLPPESLEIR
jgi:hypothetical protein